MFNLPGATSRFAEPPWRETIQIVANVTGNTEWLYARDAILKEGHAKIFTLLCTMNRCNAIKR